jgi:hypothetical protein
MAFQIPLVFCVDVEPDEFTPHPELPTPWLGFERTQGLARGWRRMLEQATGDAVAFSWFVRADPQVQRIYGSGLWPFERYRRFLEEALRAGDEIGLHAHPARWSGKQKRWVEDFADQSWVEECLRMAFVAYRGGLGEPCRSVRFGNHFMNQATSDFLERLGLEFDLTPEPGARARTCLSPYQAMTGALPDYSSFSRSVYRRSAVSFRTADQEREDGLWILPMSTAELDAGAPAEALAASDDAAYLRLGLWYPTEAFRYVFESCLYDLNPACLVMVIRSDMPLVPEFHAAIDENIRWLVTHPLRRRFVVARPEHAVRMFCELQDRTTDVGMARRDLIEPARSA